MRTRGSATGGSFETFPATSPRITTRADPDRPVAFVTDDAFSQIGGPDDYREVETRQDVLVYTSDALTAPMTICGPMTRFDRGGVVGEGHRLDDQGRGGPARWLRAAAQRRYRPRALPPGRDREVLLTPGAIERYEIDNWSTCMEVEDRAGASASRWRRTPSRSSTSTCRRADRSARKPGAWSRRRPCITTGRARRNVELPLLR